MRLSELFEGRKTFTGIIQGVQGEYVILRCEDEDREIPFENIRGGNLVYRFEDENESHKGHKRTKKRGKK